MSDHPRTSTPVSSPSPGRPTTIARPEWPWSAYTHHASRSSLHSFTTGSSGQPSSWDHRGSFLNSSRATSSPGGSSVQWQYSQTPRQTTSTMGIPGTVHESTRQWTFLGFEWVIRDVDKLRDFVEGMNVVGGVGPEHGDFEILKQSPILGDNKFKLEIARAPLSEESPHASIKPTLALYITSLMVDFSHSNYEMSASMMTAIKCQDNRMGERGAPAEWVWDFGQVDWVFRQESEVWECPLPLLSSLLENPRIQDTDSFVICVQIHCPVGPSFPQQPFFHYIPKDLLEGLEASIDNPNTGDVRFVCLERLSVDAQRSPSLLTPDSQKSPSRRSSPATSSHPALAGQTTARKRVIYAHSDILTKRSEYFSTMLSSAFSENAGLASGERKIYTIVVEEADFETIYWLLKFCYANWLLFKEDDDPRAAVDGVGAGWSAKWLNTRGGEWDWNTFHMTGLDDSNTGDTRSATSGESLVSTGELTRSGSGKSKAFQTGMTSQITAGPSGSRTISTSSKAGTSTATPLRQANPSASRRVTGSSSGAMSIGMSGSGPVQTKPVPTPVANNYTPSAHPGYPAVSPHAGRQHLPSVFSTPDPHPHPTPTPKPASALSIYQVAHRYAMPNLARLALEHMIDTITPQSSFALLLASSVWDELHTLVEDYVVEKWDEVSVSDEFERCCQEVAAGEWGLDGGKTLMRIFRRLRSPSALGYDRTRAGENGDSS